MVSKEKLHQRTNNLPELKVLHSDGAHAQPEPSRFQALKKQQFLQLNTGSCLYGRVHAAVENSIALRMRTKHYVLSSKLLEQETFIVCSGQEEMP